MKALSALRKAFSLKKTDELEKKLPADYLARIQSAMKEYAASKCQEQRLICQFEFETAYEAAANKNFDPAITDIYVLHTLKDSETPDFE